MDDRYSAYVARCAQRHGVIVAMEMTGLTWLDVQTCVKKRRREDESLEGEHKKMG